MQVCHRVSDSVELFHRNQQLNFITVGKKIEIDII